jgi:hypothetical protein
MKALPISLAVAFFLLTAVSHGEAQTQVKWMAGFNAGLGIETGLAKDVTYNPFTGTFVESGGGSRGSFVFGPSGEVIFNNNMAIMMDLAISTAPGTPILWINMFRYYFPIEPTKVYAGAGFALDFATGGPYVLLPFGGGALLTSVRTSTYPPT